MKNSISDAVMLACGIDPADSSNATAEQQQDYRETRQRVIEWRYTIGERYRQASLYNFQCSDRSRPVHAKMLKYAESIADNVKAGAGIVLNGPSGTGKDHLLAGVGAEAVIAGYWPLMITGPDLFAKMRQAIKTDTEQETVSEFANADILWLSDPTVDTLTGFQGQTLYRIIDSRYRRLKPTWVSINAKTPEEVIKAIGAQTADRLRDGAITAFCNWESFRRAK